MTKWFMIQKIFLSTYPTEFPAAFHDIIASEVGGIV